MKSQPLQELVKKIFSNEETKHQFISDPDSFLSQFSLTDREKRTVMNTHAKLGLITSDSIQLEATIGPTSTWWSFPP